MDDIIVMSVDVSAHFTKLHHGLEVLRSVSLKLKLSKCEFLLTTIKYLGHIISAQGVAPNADKVVAVQTFPSPRKAKELQSFL